MILRLIGGTVDAVAVGSEADASAAQCDYVLTSDISKLEAIDGKQDRQDPRQGYEHRHFFGAEI
ncbi:MAG: hypothetical protein IPJ30_08750 [Acidobacteria bacterium]|nr:hypothetical protein [Acidobacteriota bacterium]